LVGTTLVRVSSKLVVVKGWRWWSERGGPKPELSANVVIDWKR
jgi:hypothetical protein